MGLGDFLDSQSENFETLLAKVHAGSESAAWELVERYGSHIRAVVRRRMHAGLRSFLDSEDFVQSVWGSLVRIGPKLKEIDRPEQLIAVMSRIAQNKVIDEVRRRTGTIKHQMACHGSYGQIDAAAPVASRSVPSSPSQYAIARERWDKLLEKEPPQSRRMVELRLAGNTYDEIAALLGVNERTVRRTMGRLLEQDTDDAN